MSDNCRHCLATGCIYQNRPKLEESMTFSKIVTKINNVVDTSTTLQLPMAITWCRRLIRRYYPKSVFDDGDDPWVRRELRKHMMDRITGGSYAREEISSTNI